ncbi:DUF4062 domain-containing protein [Chitinasiproducens palmae]|uniref:DUF4062 domain-containing protein n=1 Tax=Chitinasiproducens palmae TaxID=1770053 RepID=A0A1H2PJS7_9BURK|nr:DUF4062 domain-containing protein [Chitinasiproducens palmae]SDV46653.1 protein of unknown function [Chitinasiproducens palmae]
MASSQPIRVMLSSRCADRFSEAEPVALTTVRRELKRDIEAAGLFGAQLFQVWINEDAEALDHTADSWEHCLRQVNDCDILIVLYNGNAGWAKTGEDIGICHAEYAEGLKYAPGKVRLIELPDAGPASGPAQAARNARFAAFKASAAGFRGGAALTRAALREQVQKAIVDAVLTQTRRGAEGAKGGRFDLGAALAWSRLDFAGRRAAMVAELKAVLAGRQHARPAKADEDRLPALALDGRTIVVQLHAVPAAFSVAPAREQLGRPHLQDHRLATRLAGLAGPLHLVACHRGVTETQATGLLGFPDATVVAAPFGIYLADDVQKTQFVFLANCRDPVQTRLAVQRFIEWVDQAGEGSRLADRAAARARIVAAIAREQGIV